MEIKKSDIILKNYLKKNREKYFPYILNWNDNPFPNANTEKNISMSKWLWFSTDAYSLLYLGIPFSNLMTATILILVSLIFKYDYILWISIVWFFFGIYLAYRQAYFWKFNKNLTLFDVYLKD